MPHDPPSTSPPPNATVPLAVAVQRARAGDPQAWAGVARYFGRAIGKEAGYWSARGGGATDDLVQEGQLGLRRAIETFDPRRGDFAQHAFAWIRKFVQAAAHREHRQVRIGADAARAAPGGSTQRVIDALAQRQLVGLARRAVGLAARTVTEREVAQRRLLAAEPQSLRQAARDLAISHQQVRNVEQRVRERAQAHLARIGVVDTTGAAGTPDVPPRGKE